VKGFGKRAAKMDEVRLVAVSGLQITVAVRNPLAKTYVHLNAMVERMNGKLFFGDPFTLMVREDVADSEFRALLESGGVVYVSEDAELPAKETGSAG